MSDASNNLQRAMRSGKHPVNVVAGSLRDQEKAVVDMGYKVAGKVKKAVIPVEHTLSSYQMHTTVTHPFNPLPNSNTFLGSNRIELRLTKSSAGALESCMLRIRFTESSGTGTATLVALPYIFERVEIAANGGKDIIQTLRDHDLFFQTALYKSEHWNLIASRQNLTSTWTAGAGTAQAAGTSRDYYLPLRLLFNYGDQVRLDTLDQDLILRFFTRNSLSATTGAGSLNLAAIELISESRKEPSFEYEQQMTIYRDNVHLKNFLEWIPADFVGQTITASQESSFSLRNVTGNAPFFIFALQASSSVTADAIRAFTAVEGADGSGEIDFTTPTGTRLLNDGQNAKIAYYRFERPADQDWESNFWANNPMYLIPFCDKPRDATLKGVFDGCFSFPGGEDYTLRITPSATFSTGTYNVIIRVPIFRRMIQSNGELSYEDI